VGSEMCIRDSTYLLRLRSDDGTRSRKVTMLR
jgi:hypothetical protein